MKFAHIADLHLGMRIFERKIAEDQRYILDEILKILKKEKPDGVFISGDIYDRPVPPEESVEMLGLFLSAIYDMGTDIYMISGNHDSPERIDFGNELLERAGVYVAGKFDGRLRKVTKRDEFGEIDIFLMPFIKPAVVKNTILRKNQDVDEAGGFLTLGQKSSVRNDIGDVDRNDEGVAQGALRQAQGTLRPLGEAELAQGALRQAQGTLRPLGEAELAQGALRPLGEAELAQGALRQDESTLSLSKGTESDDKLDYETAVRMVLSTNPPDTSKRNIILAHQFVNGATRMDSEEVLVGFVDAISDSVFDEFDYVALGHLHKRQSIKREGQIYCGTPLKYSFKEENNEKSVGFVQMGQKGDVRVYSVPLKPLRDMRNLHGDFDELMEGESEDFMRVVLTNDTPVPYAFNRLRVRYPNLLKLEYEKTKDFAALVKSDVSIKTKAPEELFAEFFEKCTGRELDEEEIKILEDVMRV